MNCHFYVFWLNKMQVKTNAYDAGAVREKSVPKGQSALRFQWYAAVRQAPKISRSQLN
jgi:hypothetical protein